MASFDEEIDAIVDILRSRGAVDVAVATERARSQANEAAARFGQGGVGVSRAREIERTGQDAFISALQGADLFGAQAKAGEAKARSSFERNKELQLELQRRSQEFEASMLDKQIAARPNSLLSTAFQGLGQLGGIALGAKLSPLNKLLTQFAAPGASGGGGVTGAESIGRRGAGLMEAMRSF